MHQRALIGLTKKQMVAGERRKKRAAVERARADAAEQRAEDQAPAAQRRPALGKDGSVLREPVATPDSLRPGFRRVWTIDVMHASCPREVTKAHVAAARRLLNDCEIGVWGASQGGANLDRVDSASPDGLNPWSPQLVALRRFEEAMASLRSASRLTIQRVVIENWTITRLAERLGIHRHRAHGRIWAGLEDLREHYAPQREAMPVPGVGEVVAASEDLDAMPLPQDRIGRWRAPGGGA